MHEHEHQSTHIHFQLRDIAVLLHLHTYRAQRLRDEAVREPCQAEYDSIEESVWFLNVGCAFCPYALRFDEMLLLRAREHPLRCWNPLRGELEA